MGTGPLSQLLGARSEIRSRHGWDRMLGSSAVFSKRVCARQDGVFGGGLFICQTWLWLPRAVPLGTPLSSHWPGLQESKTRVRILPVPGILRGAKNSRGRRALCLARKWSVN